MSDPAMASYPDGFWVRGVNSLLEQSLLKEGEYAWSTNANNIGGILRTRSGFNRVNTTNFESVEPRGISVFKDKNNAISMIIALGDLLYAAPFPFKNFVLVGTGVGGHGPVIFQRVVRTAISSLTGNKVLTTPTPYLIIQGGGSRAKVWDGLVLTASVPTDEFQGIPIGDWMQFSGLRLWVASGRKLHASDLGDPLMFTEERLVSGGNAIYFSDDITGLFQTPDLHNLLVATDNNTSVIQSNILDRTQWGVVQDFEKVLLSGIGCSAGMSFCHQFGMTWWYAHGGLIRLDNALNTYRSSRITFQDQLMSKDKSNFAIDTSGIVIRSYGNYLLVAVPAGSKYNAHIWLLNQRVLETDEPTDMDSWAGAWSGLNVIGMESVVVEGQQRIYALSRDIGAPTDVHDEMTPNVWELFMGSRQDVELNREQRIPCSWESRFLAGSMDFKKFEYAEIELANGRGVIDMQVFVCSRRGGYHKIMDKRISCTEGSVNSCITTPVMTVTTADVNVGDHLIEVESTANFLPPQTTVYINGKRFDVFTQTSTELNASNATEFIPKGSQVVQPRFSWPANPTILKSYLSQRRILRTSGWNESSSCPVESIMRDNIDKAFAILIKWTGNVAITGVRLVCTKVDDYTMGKCEEDENLARSLDADGEGILSPDINQPITGRLFSIRNRHSRVNEPKYAEVDYSSHQ